jgi:drug/metabolite transporter (DMT)-like permease
MTVLLFVLVILAWGFSWFAIKLQLGSVPPEVAIFHRFVLAAALLGLGLAVTGRFRPARLAQHRRFAVLGATLFGLNFLLIYFATQYVASGVVSVVFTAATIFNAVNQWLFFGLRPQARVIAGAACGMGGIGLLFASEWAGVAGRPESALGIVLALGGTYAFSLGNLASVRAAADGTDLPNVTLRGMCWGAFFLGTFALLRGQNFAPELSWRYLGGLVYLAVPGSILGFLAYLALVARSGPARAAYVTVLFPLVALTVSTLAEGYVWTTSALIGLPLILAGNLVIFAKLPGRQATRA